MRNRFFLADERQLQIRHNSGFFSNCSVSLWSITRFFNHFQRLPDHVDFSQTFQSFSDGSGRASYAEYFNHAQGMKIPYSEPIRFRRSSLFDYREESAGQIAPFLAKYFHVSDEVINAENILLKKYQINMPNTLAVCYRGTDKHRETGLGSYQEYIQVARNILDLEPRLQVLVQTDQEQFLEYCLHEFESVVSIDELPRTRGETVLHRLIPDERKIKWTKTLVAATLLMAKCKYVVLHSGNVARWVCLYRGNTSNVFQYLRPRKASAQSSKNWWLP